MKHTYLDDLYNAEYKKTFTKSGCIERYKKLCKMFYAEDRTNAMNNIVCACEDVLLNKYHVTLEEIEAAEMEVLKAM